MIINSNEKCPVCNNNFAQEDDVVVCPKCGTPHHRACYNSLGHCANSDKHSSGFEYISNADNNNEFNDKEDKVSSEHNNSYTDNQNYYNPQSSEYYNSSTAQDAYSNKTKCTQCNAEINKAAPFCSHCGARQNNAQYGDYNPINNYGFGNTEQQQYENDTQTIDGKSIADVANVVRINTHRFIPKFIQNKKISWNWGAFFFGPYYLFYRKMYKQGAVFLAINVIVQFIINGIYAKELNAFMSFFYANYQTLYSNPSSSLASEMTALSNAVMPAMYLILGSSLIISVIIALFADSFYKTRVMEVLDKVEHNLQEGADFNVLNPMMGDAAPLSQADMRKLYLGKMGGTSILSPIAAYCILNIITRIVTQIISLF
ncbi:MAG: DUF2628 domain-containing protein [Eubacterium sp.]|nr:DUF2628 domain-containing protein [Eubacterium sp.]